jgi:hypothetical protein
LWEKTKKERKKERTDAPKHVIVDVEVQWYSTVQWYDKKEKETGVTLDISGWKSFREDRYTANTKACRPGTTVTGLQVNGKAGSLLETISFAMSRSRRGRCAVFFSRVGAAPFCGCAATFEFSVTAAKRRQTK